MDYKITCPYCAEKFYLSIYHEDGHTQEFIFDCEVCCHPIDIKAHWDEHKERFKLAIGKDSSYDDFTLGW